MSFEGFTRKLFCNLVLLIKLSSIRKYNYLFVYCEQADYGGLTDENFVFSGGWSSNLICFADLPAYLFEAVYLNEISTSKLSFIIGSNIPDVLKIEVDAKKA